MTIVLASFSYVLFLSYAVNLREFAKYLDLDLFYSMFCALVFGPFAVGYDFSPTHAVKVANVHIF